jgi:hypothetical protein
MLEHDYNVGRIMDTIRAEAPNTPARVATRPR